MHRLSKAKLFLSVIRIQTKSNLWKLNPALTEYVAFTKTCFTLSTCVLYTGINDLSYGSIFVFDVSCPLRGNFVS